MNTIQEAQQELAHHPIYSSLTHVNAIKHFMHYHVFAVWDFMSLLKSLQSHMTCVSIPWRPSPYPTEMVRLINQIVVGEESDLDQEGKAISHFDLYLKGMEEVGASTALVNDFLTDLNFERIPLAAREFVQGNIEMALQGDVVEVAASFFFGREKLIPSMFEAMTQTLKKERIKAPTFLYYLERHIEVDGEEHGPLAMKCLEYLTQNNPELKERALAQGLKSLKARKKLWDQVLLSMPTA
jgi:hypothetical protein